MSKLVNYLILVIVLIRFFSVGDFYLFSKTFLWQTAEGSYIVSGTTKTIVSLPNYDRVTNITNYENDGFYCTATKGRSAYFLKVEKGEVKKEVQLSFEPEMVLTYENGFLLVERQERKRCIHFLSQTIDKRLSLLFDNVAFTNILSDGKQILFARNNDRYRGEVQWYIYRDQKETVLLEHIDFWNDFCAIIDEKTAIQFDWENNCLMYFDLLSHETSLFLKLPKKHGGSTSNMNMLFFDPDSEEFLLYQVYGLSDVRRHLFVGKIGSNKLHEIHLFLNYPISQNMLTTTYDIVFLKNNI